MDKEQLNKYLNFDDILNNDPISEPFVILSCSETYDPIETPKFGLDSEVIDIRSCMVNVNSKELAFKTLDFSHMYFNKIDYFEKDTSGKMKYVINESWEYFSGLTIEPLYIRRHWEGLKLSIYEPSQRMILYLNLFKNNKKWIDPYKEEEVIRIVKEEKSSNGLKHTIDKIEIKIDYLKDYLSARESGLFIAKYARRNFKYESPDQIPLEKKDKDIPNGTFIFNSSVDNPVLSMIANGNTMTQSELTQYFWINPLPKPRRWDARNRSEFEGDVIFTLHDGERRTYNVEAKHEKDYFELLSFSPRLIDIFINQPNHDYEEYSKETLGLKFPNGESLHVAINPSGQIQAWWGQVAKLSKEHQQKLALFSEPWLNKLNSHHDYIRTTIYGESPQTIPFKKIIQEYKNEINNYFLSIFNETFFNEDSSIKDLKRVFEPYESDPNQLLDIMEYLDKWLLSEKRPYRIIEHYRLNELIDNKNDLSKIKSLVSLKLLIKKYFGNDEAENKTTVLKLIKELRNCKAHVKDLSKIYEKYNLKNKSSREIYKSITTDLEEFLKWLFELCKASIFS
jgi:hypothetical protein